jgi:hypothetical protein
LYRDSRLHLEPFTSSAMKSNISVVHRVNMRIANSSFDEQQTVIGESSGYLGTMCDSTGNPVLFLN